MQDTDTILAFLDRTESDQFTLLENLILQGSHTRDKEGVDAVGQIICSSLSLEELDLQIVPVATHGDHLIFRSRGCRNGQPPILLTGHTDTVFPKDSSFNYYREDKLKAYGPGIIDMKGGLVTAVYTLKALHAAGLLTEIPLVFICNSDEEMGSPTSRQLITEEAAKSLCALVFECGGLGGEIVTGRKGKVGYRLEIEGRAGHAAFTNGKKKVSAILELAHKTIQLEGLNDPERQIIVNVGHIEGGSAPNVIAEGAMAQIDTRFLTKKDGASCYKKIQEIVTHCTIENTKAHVEITTQRPPMEQSADNRILYTLFQEQAKLLSIPLKEELRSGVSDANTIAACSIPVLDGLGPIGDLDHSDKEYMIKESLKQRCQLTALSILSLWQRQKRDDIFASR